MHENSLFIVLEGLDGSGKTSVSRYLTSVLNSQEQGKVKNTFEPHDPSCAGIYIRQVLMKKITAFHPRTLALAFATNRLDHCERQIKPWLKAKKGNLVLCDRYYLSSLVYQSSQDLDFRAVLDLNSQALKPDMIFFLNVSDEVCYARMAKRNEPKELFESKLSETREKFREAIQFLRKENGDHIVEIDGSGTIEEVAGQILAKISTLRPGLDQLQTELSNLKVAETAAAEESYTLRQAKASLELTGEGIPGETRQETDSRHLNLAKEQLAKLSFARQGGLFLDYLRSLGLSVGKQLPWAGALAYELQHQMPGGLKLRGTALMLHSHQGYEEVIKRVPDIPEMSDFMFVFFPENSGTFTGYFQRDKIVYNSVPAGEKLLPAIRSVTLTDLAAKLLDFSEDQRQI